MLLVLIGSVADLARAMKEQGSRQAVAGLALVELLPWLCRVGGWPVFPSAIGKQGQELVSVSLRQINLVRKPLRARLPARVGCGRYAGIISKRSRRHDDFSAAPRRVWKWRAAISAERS